MVSINRQEVLRKALFSLVSHARDTVPAGATLPDDKMGIPILDSGILLTLDHLKRDGFDRPLRPLLEAALDAAVVDGYTAFPRPEGFVPDPMFELVVKRLTQLFGAAEWFQMYQDEAQCSGELAMPLWLIRAGCKTKEDGIEACRKILSNAGLLKKRAKLKIEGKK
jgi:hypothetical protein